MSAHPSSVEPPKPPPPGDGVPAGPVEPPKAPPPGGDVPPGPVEPDKGAPQESTTEVSATAVDGNAALEPFDAPQAPMDGLSAAAAGEIGVSEAPQAPGPDVSAAP